MYVVSRFLPVHLPVTAGGGPGVDWRDRDRVGRLIADGTLPALQRDDGFRKWLADAVFGATYG